APRRARSAARARGLRRLGSGQVISAWQCRPGPRQSVGMPCCHDVAAAGRRLAALGQARQGRTQMMIDDELLTLEQALALMPTLWDAIEFTILEHVRGRAIARGFDEGDVSRVIEESARALRTGRAARVATAKQMLEQRCAAVH